MPYDGGGTVVICIGGRSPAGVVVGWDAAVPVCDGVVDIGAEVG